MPTTSCPAHLSQRPSASSLQPSAFRPPLSARPIAPPRHHFRVVTTRSLHEFRGPTPPVGLRPPPSREEVAGFRVCPGGEDAAAGVQTGAATALGVFQKLRAAAAGLHRHPPALLVHHEEVVLGIAGPDRVEGAGDERARVQLTGFVLDDGVAAVALAAFLLAVAASAHGRRVRDRWRNDSSRLTRPGPRTTLAP